MSDDMEERLREALRTAVAPISPDPYAAHRENLRRLSLARRRRVVLVPATAAVATLALLIGFAVVRAMRTDHHQPRAAGQRHRTAAPPAGLPANLDPRYLPAGGVMKLGSTTFWFAGPGTGTLCWRESTGGGDCTGSTIPPGRHAAIIGIRNDSTLYGITDAEAVTVVLARPRARPVRAVLATGRGLPLAIWQVGYKGRPGPQESIVVSDRQGTMLNRLTVTPGLGTLGRPLTRGVPLFTYRRQDGSAATIQAYADGDTAGLGTLESTPASGGGQRWFGSVISIEPGNGPSWWYGFMGGRMTRVVARLDDGHTTTARIIPVGRFRAFAVQVPADSPGGKGHRGRLIGTDASGAELASWRF